jgi:DivIVA domain-containing protein
VIWLTTVLVVLVLGGVAVVAAGRGAPMVEEYDDRPDVVVPTGRLAGDDLRRVRFGVCLRGYRMAEVDALLDRLAQQLDGQVDPSERPPDTTARG